MLLKADYGELFPTRKSFVVFIAYMALFVNQGLLVTASQNQSDNSYNYNIVLVVLITEAVKLLVSVLLYCKENHPKTFCSDFLSNSNVMMLYFIPAFLYCLYNNLAFINLSAFDPTSYFLLLQFRVVITAILFQIVFNKKLSKQQWFSLMVLTLGCVVKHVDLSGPPQSPAKLEPQQPLDNTTGGINIWMNFLLILVQVVCSCLAGVYNEFILKKPGSEVNIYIQNSYMYIDSIVCNAAVLLYQGNISQVFSADSINLVLKYKVLLVIVNNAAIGIVTSFFLQSLNSIVKTFASALELIFTAILSWILFDIPIFTNTICAIILVSLAVIVYSQNPINNTRPAASDDTKLKSKHISAV
ncbi:UDP-galactose transporter senju-like [Nilaparvata lugens]|uniref:UDP-galactose transporter senju-like n=1 Tax=Nilaparvata lugens TaxID=108931 RepID=UPI00193CE1EB|nr:UDP-galactose transporter senju-like [Nilaparvata lugens]